MFIICRTFLPHTAQVISGKSLKLGQVIAAVIASVLKMTFKSSLGLGCLQGTHFFFFFLVQSPKGKLTQGRGLVLQASPLGQFTQENNRTPRNAGLQIKKVTKHR